MVTTQDVLGKLELAKTALTGCKPKVKPHRQRQIAKLVRKLQDLIDLLEDRQIEVAKYAASQRDDSIHLATEEETREATYKAIDAISNVQNITE